MKPTATTLDDIAGAITDLGTMMGSQITELRDELHNEVGGLRNEMRTEISSLRSDTNQRLTALEVSNTYLGGEVQALRGDVKELYSLVAS